MERPRWTTADGTREWLPADAVICAVPPPAAAELLEGLPNGRPIAASFRRLGTTRVQTLRFVFEPGPAAPVRHGVALTRRAGFVFLCLDTFMPAYQGSGERTVEIQAMPEAARGADVEALVRRLLPDGRSARLREILTPDAVPYARYGVGGGADRLGVRSQWPNLFFAGDWVHDPGGAWFMERAVSTARAAAGVAAVDAGARRPLESPGVRTARRLARIAQRSATVRRRPPSARRPRRVSPCPRTH
jgi:hypothetical protein